jgi:NAD(P)-dependent dehydrogenase (short-subunit alcohol dehydrogenase family)
VENDVQRFARTVLDKFSSVDILINNAGGNVRYSHDSLIKTTLGDWRHVMDLNAFGTYLVTRAFLP